VLDFIFARLPRIVTSTVVTVQRAEFDRQWEAVRASQHRLESLIEPLTDDDARRPSQLPGWTVGHLLTHLARNAEGLTRIADGAGQGIEAEMYPSGDYPDGQQRRDADIEAGAGRCADELHADIADTARRLDESISRLTDGQLHGFGRTRLGRRPIGDVPMLRRREIEVHLVDLGIGYQPADWPDDFVRSELRTLGMLWDSRRPLGMTGLPAAALVATPSHRLAWLFGRASIDGLDPANVYTA